MANYSFNLSWSEDDNGYIATVPEFPNLSAFGETQEEALQEAQFALEGYIEEMQNNKDSLPVPICLSKFSGQLRLRMPKTLHAQLTQEAEKENHSLNSHIVYLLTERRLLNAIDKFEEKINLFNYWQNLDEKTDQFEFSEQRKEYDFAAKETKTENLTANL